MNTLLHILLYIVLASSCLVFSMDKKRNHKKQKPQNAIQIKADFEDALNGGLYSNAGILLQNNPGLQKDHPIGKALWSIWKEKAKSFELGHHECGTIAPIQVLSAAEQFAIEAKNKDFLKLYCDAVEHDTKIREIIFPYHHNSENFENIFNSWKSNIFRQL